MTYSRDYIQPSVLIAFDVGTVNTGAAYCIRESEDEHPVMRNVTRWGRTPQKLVSATNTAKIPSTLYYDRGGDLMCVGAETLAVREEARSRKWTKVQWLNLYIRSRYKDGEDYDLKPEPLPRNKNIEDIFSDFYKYLIDCVFTFIEDAHPYITQDKMFSSAKFVLTVPSAWTAIEREKLEFAMAKALSNRTSIFHKERLSFVDNERAVLHYCMASRLLDHIPEHSQFTVADLGGALTSFASFTVTDSANQRYRQVGRPTCTLQGSEAVTRRACCYIKRKLRFSNYGTPNDITSATLLFEKESKTSFSGEGDVHIAVAGALASDAKHDVQNGRLILRVNEVLDCFKGSLYTIGRSLVHIAPRDSTIYMVGEFSESPYMRLKLTKALHGKGRLLKFCDNPALRIGAVGALYDAVESHLDQERSQSMVFSPNEDWQSSTSA